MIYQNLKLPYFYAKTLNITQKVTDKVFMVYFHTFDNLSVKRVNDRLATASVIALHLMLLIIYRDNHHYAISFHYFYALIKVYFIIFKIKIHTLFQKEMPQWGNCILNKSNCRFSANVLLIFTTVRNCPPFLSNIRVTVVVRHVASFSINCRRRKFRILLLSLIQLD